MHCSCRGISPGSWPRTFAARGFAESSSSRCPSPRFSTVERVKTLRVGVAGLGFGATVHLPGLQSLPGVQVVALAGRHLDKARELAARHGVKTVAGSWQEL